MSDYTYGGTPPAPGVRSNPGSGNVSYYYNMKAGLLDDPEEWHYRNMSITAGYHLEGTQNRTKEDKLVWKWMKDHLGRKDYYRFVARVIKARITCCLKSTMHSMK